MIYLGLPLWYGSGRLIDLIQVVHERGFDYVEISLDYPWPEAIDEFEMEELVKSIRGYGIEVGIHGPWRDISLGSPRDVIRRAALKVYRRCVKFASRLESHYFNFHVFTKEATEYEEVYKAAYAATRRSVKEICRMCKEANIIPTLENNPTDFLGSVDEIWGLLKENEGHYVIIAIPCQLEGIFSYIYEFFIISYLKIIAGFPGKAYSAFFSVHSFSSFISILSCNSFSKKSLDSSIICLSSEYWTSLVSTF